MAARKNQFFGYTAVCPDDLVTLEEARRAAREAANEGEEVVVFQVLTVFRPASAVEEVDPRKFAEGD